MSLTGFMKTPMITTLTRMTMLARYALTLLWPRIYVGVIEDGFSEALYQRSVQNISLCFSIPDRVRMAYPACVDTVSGFFARRAHDLIAALRHQSVFCPVVCGHPKYTGRECAPRRLDPGEAPAT